MRAAFNAMRILGLVTLLVIAFIVGVNIGPKICVLPRLEPYLKLLFPAKSTCGAYAMPDVVKLVEILTSYSPEGDKSARNLYELCVAQQAGGHDVQQCTSLQTQQR